MGTDQERLTLYGMAKRGIWPTPTVKGNHNRAGSSPRSGDGLATAVSRWPTPTSRDWKGAGLTGPGGKYLQLGGAVPGPLNPNWVEWLMGLPIGWTDSAPLGTQSFRQWQRGHSQN